MSIYEKLHNFGTLVYTVGDGSPHGSVSKTEVNALNRGNVQCSVDLLSHDPDAVLFIAGGNSGEHGKRGDGVPGSLREAERMVANIQHMVREAGASATLLERVLTDCDPEFYERYTLRPSGNTIENAQNAVAVVKDGKMKHADVVAEINHLSRVIGTFRKKLMDEQLLDSLFHMRGHPVLSKFEEDADQAHIQSLHRFLQWEWKAKAHHLLTGNVPRVEFATEWLRSTWRKVRGRAMMVEDQNGREYAPTLIYQDMMDKPFESRNQ